MMFQPQFYGLKSVVNIYTVVNIVYKVVKPRKSFLQVDLLRNIERNLAFTSIYGIIPRRGL